MSADELFKQAWHYFLDSKFDECVTAFEELRKFDESSFGSELLSKVLHLEALIRGRSATTPGEFRHVLDLLQESIDLDPPENVRRDAHLNKAVILMRIGKFLEAIEECNHAVRLDSECAQAYQVLSEGYFHLGFVQKGLDMLEQSKQLLINSGAKEDVKWKQMKSPQYWIQVEKRLPMIKQDPEQKQKLKRALIEVNQKNPTQRTLRLLLELS